MNIPAITRIAPSPTGMFHVGTARTALINYAVARQSGGQFLLRIEDTDRARHSDAAVAGIHAAMAWLGLDTDGTPVIQSTRAARHEAEALRLHASGHAYWCDCTTDQIAARSPQAGYDGHCAHRNLSRAANRILRFGVPRTGDVVVNDTVYGENIFPAATISDFAIMRADGTALFHLANVIDDFDMGVNYVIRGNDHLPNTPKYQLLFDALGYGTLPKFAHLPLLVRIAEDGSRPKLSKRYDRVAIEDYRDAGFLAGAMCQYLTGLSFSSVDADHFDLAEFVADFDLSRIIPAPAVFDETKLRSINASHLRAWSQDHYVQEVRRFAPAVNDVSDELLATTQVRASTLGEVPAMVSFIRDPVQVDADTLAAITSGTDVCSILDSALAAYRTCNWTPDIIQQVTMDEVVAPLGSTLRKVQLPLRVAVTGQRVGLPLFETIAALSRDEALARIANLRILIAK